MVMKIIFLLRQLKYQGSSKVFWKRFQKQKFSIYDIDFKTDFKNIKRNLETNNFILNGYRNNKRYIPEIIKETEKLQI